MRDDRGYWSLGIRTHAELRTLIEEKLTGHLDEESENYNNEKLELIQKLPQIFLY